ncbi:MAG: hypothetical protein K2N72_11615 [Oscillospiraceae bacterium]|nr:hypothetical protein [Oscillospiraceae bacterium]
MAKIVWFIKNHTYAAVNSAGAVLMILTIFVEGLASFGLLAVILAAICSSILPALLIILLIINVAAFFTVDNFKTVPGIILTVIGGSIGAMLAVRDTGEDFPARKAVRIIFLIKVWLALWLTEGFLLYELGVFDFSIFPN